MPRSLGRAKARFNNSGVDCQIVPYRVESLSDYFAVFSSTFGDDHTFWFRGHADFRWSLTPSAFRFETLDERDRALGLLSEFKRLTEFRLPRAPRHDEELKWTQLAQHYGLPTRLLDWSESATTALFFACLKPQLNGLVIAFNPVDLNRLRDSKRPRIFDAQSDADLIFPYLKNGGAQNRRSRYTTLAIKPVLNDERLVMQRGVFTLHGNREFALTKKQAPSLVAVPVLKEAKRNLRAELARIGVDEMTLFPDPEHTCNELKRAAHLSEDS